MLQSGDDPVSGDQRVVPPQFDLRPGDEIFLPGNPLLCMLVQDGDVVRARVVNTAHGLTSYLHAAWHAERPMPGHHHCSLGDACGYIDREDGDGHGPLT